MKMWPKNYINSKISFHIDVQDCDNEESRAILSLNLENQQTAFGD